MARKWFISDRQLRFLNMILLALAVCLGIVLSIGKIGLATPTSLIQQGEQFYNRGQFEQALEQWKQAETQYSGDELGVAGSRLNQAQALAAMGLQRQACKRLTEALQISEPICDTSYEQATEGKKLALDQSLPLDLQAAGLRSLGEVLRAIGNLETAQTVLSMSRETAQNQPELQGRILLSLGNLARDLGNRERDRKDEISDPPPNFAIATNCFTPSNPITDEINALGYYQQSLACYEQTTNSFNTPLTQAQAQLNSLSLLLEIDQWFLHHNSAEIADRWWSQIQGIATQQVKQLQASLENFPKTYEAVYAQINLARSLVRIEQRSSQTSSHANWQEIEKLLQQARQQARQLDNRQAESYALGSLGWLYEQQPDQKLEDALGETEKALGLARLLSSKDMVYQWAWQQGRILKQQGNVPKAIAAYDNAVKALKEARQNLTAVNPDAQFSLRDNAEPIYREYVDLLLLTDKEPSQENLQKSLNLIDSLQLAELEDFLRCSLATADPIYINRDKDRDPTAAVIYPIILTNRLAIIFQLPGETDLKYQSISLNQAELQKTLRNLHYLLSTDGATPDIIEQSQILYGWLIAPIEAELQASKAKTLAFVLDGALRSIPMSVLYDRETEQYLLEKDYALVIAPRLKLFSLNPLQRDQLHVFFGGAGEQQPMKNYAAIKIQDELKGIQVALPSNALLKSLLEENFTKTNLKASLSTEDFSIIHIKTHGEFSSNLKNTFLIAYQEERIQGNELDGLIQSNHRPGAVATELLVLSACRTAEGDNRAALGMAGIAIKAGASSILSTLWEAEDGNNEAASSINVELMKRFYQELSNSSNNKAQALHAAQLSLYRDYGEQNPIKWAPYILVGNWL